MVNLILRIARWVAIAVATLLTILLIATFLSFSFVILTEGWYDTSLIDSKVLNIGECV
jgi:hypothetical protein